MALKNLLGWYAIEPTPPPKKKKQSTSQVLKKSRALDQEQNKMLLMYAGKTTYPALMREIKN